MALRVEIDLVGPIDCARLSLHGGSLLGGFRLGLVTGRIARPVRSRRSQISTATGTSPIPKHNGVYREQFDTLASVQAQSSRVVCNMPSLESKVPPPAVVLVMAVFMWLISRAVPPLHFDLPAHRWLAGVLVSTGFLTGISGVVTFLKAKTTVDPTKPRASSLVTWGVYAISRNPMYLGGLIMLLGWAFFLLNALAFLFLPVYVFYINRFQLAPEERALTSLFGETYVAYHARTRRWL
jgi:protein-S-isoprenylcysteine O-methyltransferase Ste14